MASSPQSLVDPVQNGFAKASSYDKYRPTYSHEEVEHLLTDLQLTDRHGAKVLDLGAGTGKFTEVLAARPEKFETVAVEPHDDMRAELEKKSLQGVQVLKGWASSIPVHSQSVDAVVVAQVCPLV
jgi:ubiquinone/menaquinone biosynthesis C-methylase UbiE